jgi:hypothetical protein
MRTPRLVPAIALAVVLAAGHAPSQDGKKDPPPAKAKQDPRSPQAKLMAEKLKHAQLLLDGLATNDFAKITKAADELLVISKAAEFTAARKTREYQLHTNNFRRALEEIAKKAKEKNLEGATLGYVDMTLTCVRCHQHTRESGNALLPTPPRPATGVGGQ